MEIRSTAPGVLDSLGYKQLNPPADATRYEAIFSIVVDDPQRKTRALPSLYHGKAQVFAHRDIAPLGARMKRALEVIAAADTDAAYLATACRIGESCGIYTRDIFNRSSFRLHMTRLGAEFAEDPYVTLMPSGAFRCQDWGEFDAQFMIAGGPFPTDEDAVDDRSGGLAPFMFGILRAGQIRPSELALLGKFVRRAPILASHSPQAILGVLGRTDG